MVKKTNLYYFIAIFFISLICLYPLVSAFSVNIPQDIIKTGANYSINVNNTDHFGGYSVDEFVTYLSDFYCSVFGCTMLGDITFSGTGLANVAYILFDTTFVETGHSEGLLHWNSNDGTLEVDMPGGAVHLQIGQETLIKAKEASGQDIKNGDVVYISGASGQTPEITKADADSYSSSFVLGVATEDFGTNGYVTLTGLVRDVNTSGMIEGSPIWLSQESGKFVTTRPTSPAMSVFIGYVVYAHATEGIIAIRPVVVPRLMGLSDVLTEIPTTDGEYLAYNSTTNRFELVNQTTSKTYLANSILNISGIASGNVSDIWYYNGGSYNITEKSGIDPLEVRINYTNVTDFNQLIIREYYLGSSSHFIKVQIYDYDSATWEDYFEFVGQDGFSILTVPVYDSQEHIDNGLVQVRLQHQGTGIASHKLYIDFAWLQQGQITGGSTNLDGYAKYNYGTNDFNGFGSFTTTTNVTANLLNTSSLKFDGSVPTSTCQRLYDNGTALIYNYTRC